MKKHNTITSAITAVAAAVLLSACGGSDSPAPTAGGVLPVTPGGTQPMPGAPEAVKAETFAGTWKGFCEQAEDIYPTDRPTEKVYASNTMTLGKVSDTRLSLIWQVTYYPTDTCSGTPWATETHQSANNSIVIDGSAVVQGASYAMVTVNIQAIGGLVAGGRININGLSYPGNHFMTSYKWQDIAGVVGDKLFLGNDSADGQGYPTGINTLQYFTKQ